MLTVIFLSFSLTWSMHMHDNWMDLNYVPPYDLFTMLLTWWLQYKLYGFKEGGYVRIYLQITLKWPDLGNNEKKQPNDYIAMATKLPFLHDMTKKAFMQKQFSSHNKSQPIYYQIAMSICIQKQLGQIVLDHCSHFG